jgi:galactose-1-phosphate uridylyltransferase
MITQSKQTNTEKQNTERTKQKTVWWENQYEILRKKSPKPRENVDNLL